MFVSIIIHKLLQKQCYIKRKSLYKYTKLNILTTTTRYSISAIGNPFSTHHDPCTARSLLQLHAPLELYELTSIPILHFRNDGSATRMLCTLLRTLQNNKGNDKNHSSVRNACNICSYLRDIPTYTHTDMQAKH